MKFTNVNYVHRIFVLLILYNFTITLLLFINIYWVISMKCIWSGKYTCISYTIKFCISNIIHTIPTKNSNMEITIAIVTFISDPAPFPKKIALTCQPIKITHLKLLVLSLGLMLLARSLGKAMRALSWSIPPVRCIFVPCALWRAALGLRPASFSVLSTYRPTSLVIFGVMPGIYKVRCEQAQMLYVSFSIC